MFQVGDEVYDATKSVWRIGVVIEVRENRIIVSYGDEEHLVGFHSPKNLVKYEEG